jgi:hypothetical protein
LRHHLACQTGQDNRNMRALPFRRDRASASTSRIGSGSPTYGRDVSEIVHRRRAWSSSVVSWATSACSCSGRRAARQAIGYGPQFIEHGGVVSRHADLIGCVMAGLSLLDGALDVNGEGMRQDGQDASDSRLTARTAPMMTAPPCHRRYGSHRRRRTWSGRHRPADRRTAFKAGV